MSHQRLNSWSEKWQVAVAMPFRILALQVNGEEISLQVTPETTGADLQSQIKDKQLWDETARRTTAVEIVVGDRP